MKEGFIAVNRIYKDQGVAANRGKLIQAGDVVTLVYKNSDGTEAPVNVTVVGVHASGKGITWDYGTSAYRGNDIARVGSEHGFEVDGTAKGWSIAATENSSGAGLAAAVSIVLEGATFALTAAETGSPATGFTTEFKEALEDEINTLLNGNGICYVTSTTGTLTIQILATKLTPGTVVITNTTVASSWTLL